MRPIFHEFDFTGNHSRLFDEDDFDAMMSNRRPIPQYSHTPTYTLPSFFDENNCHLHHDPFKKEDNNMCHYKSNLYGDEELFEKFYEMTGHHPY